MKKIFALALAAVMTAGMTTVAFAETFSKDKDAVFVGIDAAGADSTTVYKLEDGVAKDSFDASMLKGGDQIAIPIVYGKDKGDNGIQESELAWYTIDADYDKSVNVYDDWKVGKADVELDYVKYEKGGSFSSLKDYRVYSVIVTIPDNNTNKVADLSGTISVGRTRTKAKDAAHTMEIELSYAPNAVAVDKNFDGGYADGIVDFATDCGEIDIEFGEEALFTVDATGQKNLNLAWNTAFDSEFADKYNYANIDFLTFEGKPSFNKTGVMYIYAEEDAFVYEVTEDGAKAIKGLKWDEDYEAWTFKTRKLGSYVISDVELDEKTVTEDKNESSKPAGDKENPDTGR